MDYSDALDSHPQGCIIRFEVVPGSSRLGVPSDPNPGRGSRQVRLKLGPTRGRANRQLVEELARTLGVAESRIEVIKGEKSGRKLLLVKGIEKDRAVLTLKPLLEQ